MFCLTAHKLTIYIRYVFVCACVCACDRKGHLQESIMYYEEFVSCAREQNEDEMVVRGCNAAGYVYNLIVRHFVRFTMLRISYVDWLCF